MNDDAYPRPTRSLGFDLLAKNPQPGDRSRRNDDRYLFLEVLLSAREKLHLSYVGQSIQDNSRRPPRSWSVNLLDTMEAGYRMGDKAIPEQLIRRHPLQAFSPEYFKKSQQERFFSYSTENLEAARKARNPRASGKAFIPAGLPEPPAEWRTVDLRTVLPVFREPGRIYPHPAIGDIFGGRGGWFSRKPNPSRSKGWKNMIWNRGWSKEV